MLQKISKNLLNKIIINEEELIYFYKLIFIPTNIRTEIIVIYYNKLFKDYLNVKKTIELIIRNYYIPNLR